MCLLTNFCLLSFTDGGHPTASQSVSLGFNGTKNARAFAHQIGKPMRVSRGQLNTGRKLLQSSSPSPTDIAYKTLASAINASSSAQEGTVAVKQVGSEWHFGFSRQHAWLQQTAWLQQIACMLGFSRQHACPCRHTWAVVCPGQWLSSIEQ